MQKAYSNWITWANKPSTQSPIDQVALNKISVGLDTVDDRVIALDASKANQSDLLTAVKSVVLNETTGVITITKMDDTVTTYDTALEKVAINFDYDDDPTSAHYEQLVITLEDGSYKYIDLSKLITQYEFQDTTTIQPSVVGGKVSMSIKQGSIDANLLKSSLLADIAAAEAAAEAYAQDAYAYKEEAAADALLSESHNHGNTGARDNEGTDNAMYYKNQANYYATQASTEATSAANSATNAANSASSASTSATNAATSASNAATSETNAATSEANASTSETNAATSETNASNSALDSEAWAVGKRNGVDVGSTDDTYENNSKYYSVQSGLSATASANSATASANSATSAENSSLDSEAWSVGERNGTPVEYGDETYHNNAKYWAAQAESAVAGGVSSFNGRSGYVTPLADDYSIDMIMPTSGAAEGKLVGVDANGELNAIYDGGHKILNENGTQFAQRSKLKFINAEIIDDSTNDTTIVTVQGGGVALSDVSGATITTVKRSVSITWTDPTDVIVDGTTLATWAGTVVVRKKGSAPQNKMDGTQIVDETVRNTYSSSALTDTLDYDGTYYYRFFPYSTTGSVTKGSSVTSTPERVAITTVPTPSTVTYDGTSQSPTWSNYDSDELTIGGDTYGTTSGTYTATFTPTYDYKWSDDSASKSVNWTIDKAAITPPTVTDTAKTYNGSLQSVTVSAYDSDIVTVTGVSGTNADSYTVTMSLIDTTNYEWSDSTILDKTVPWTISKASVTPPTVTGTTKTYNGSSQSVTVSAYDSNVITVTGTSGTDAGSYTVTMSLVDTSNYEWSDSSTADKTVSWTISKASVTPPTVTDTSKTYNGSSQSVTVSAYDSNVVTVTGTSATNVGSYTVTMSLVDTSNYEWSDSSVSAKETAWVINKALGAISISPTTVTLDSTNKTASLAVDWTGDGSVSVESSNTTIATVSPITLVSAGNVTVTATEKSGTVTITASLSEGTNYTSATATCTVSCNFLKIVSWANGTDAEIVALVQAADNGDIDLYADAGWRVGDERVVTLSAMQASGTASNGVSYSVGETHVSQTVTLVLMNRGGKTLSGGGTCNFVFGLKNMLANNGSREGGYMNSTNTNAGGWNSCARRNWCNGAFYDAFPSTLRPILKQFINHTATGDSTAATDSTDWFALASEVEIFGATTYANATAETGNTQFEYYTTSANRIKKQGDTGSAGRWWERSPFSGTSRGFCGVDSGGGADSGGASGTRGLAPFGCL